MVVGALATVTNAVVWMVYTHPLGNYRTSGDYPNYSITEIGQNTEKSPGDLRRFAVTQDSNGKLLANAGVKNFQMVWFLFFFIGISTFSVI